jgi:hypothetical protein
MGRKVGSAEFLAASSAVSKETGKPAKGFAHAREVFKRLAGAPAKAAAEAQAKAKTKAQAKKKTKQLKLVNPSSSKRRSTTKRKRAAGTGIQT